MARPAGMGRPPKNYMERLTPNPEYPNANKKYGPGKMRERNFDDIEPIPGNKIHDRIINEPWYDEDLICRCAYDGPFLNSYGMYINLVSKSDLENPQYQIGQGSEVPVADWNTTRQPIPAAGASYHLTCMKPTFYALEHVVRVCEGCGDYYVPDARIGEWPVKWPLCRNCKGSTKLSTSGRGPSVRRGEFKFEV